VDTEHESTPSKFVLTQNVESDHQDRVHKELGENATRPMGQLHAAGELGVQRTLLLIDKKLGVNQCQGGEQRE
jgi:hypothetical protein